MEDERIAPAPPEVDRLSVLEHQVRQLTSRLAAWVEAQLVEAMEDRRRELGALRSELDVVVRQQLTPVRGELDALRSDVSEAVGSRGPGTEVEQRVRQAMMRLTESIEGQLAEAAAARRSEADALHAALVAEIEERVAAAAARTSAALAAMQDQLGQRDARIAERLEAVAADLGSARAGVSALTAEAEESRNRTEAFEQRVKAAMGRLSDSVEARLGEAATARQDELDRFRSELAARLEAVTVDSARAADAAARVEAAAGVEVEQVALLQQQLKAGVDRALATVEARLAEHASAMAADAAAQRGEIEAAVSREVAELRTEIAANTNTIKSGLGRGFARLDAVEAAAGARLEALEVHTRRTDAKLGELVDEKYALLAGKRDVELQQFRKELEAGVAAELGRLRVEVATAVERVSQELADASASLAEQRAASETALAAQVDEVRASTSSLVAQFDGRGAEAQATLTSTVEQMRGQLAAMGDALRTEIEARTAALEARAAELAERAPELAELAATDAELAEALASAGRESAGADDRVRGKLTALGERIDALAGALERAVATESGALAPLRSDVRALQDQVAELVASSAPRPAVAKKAPTKTTTRVRRPRQ